MLVLAGFLVGGVYSFARNRRWGPAIILAIFAVMSVVTAFLWAPRQ